MDSIGQLFDKFAVTYKHSLYAIEQEENKSNRKRLDDRANVKKKYSRERSKTLTLSVNNLIVTIHKLKEISQQMCQSDDNIIKVAEYLVYGKTHVENLEKIDFSETSIPNIIPFIGHGNVLLESNGDECHTTGLQFALQTLKQTASGQLSITVINPELRPEFFAFTRLQEFQMLTNANEINNFLLNITEEIVEVDALLQGRYNSLVELRKVAQQPVGRLRLIVVQDIPQTHDGDLGNQLIRIMRGASRAGIAVLFLSSKNSVVDSTLLNEIMNLPNFVKYQLKGNQWYNSKQGCEQFTYQFPLDEGATISKVVSEVMEEAQKSSAVTIPFSQIDDVGKMWTEDASEHIIFNLGKSGLDIVSVCLGDKVTQRHNILISGAVGKGKSNLLEVMIHSLCWRYSPNELELYLLDFKDGLTFKSYAEKNDKSWLPHAKMLGLESDRDVGLAVLKDLENERLQRAELFRSAPNGGVKGYESYRKKNPESVIPRIVLIIDEYQKLFETSDEISEEAANLLENLVRQGRACAIHVVLASQSINGTAGLLGKDERIYAQFPVRIALQNTLSESYALFGIGNDAASQLRVRGEAVINENYGAIDSNQKFTVAYAEPKETKAIRQSFCRKCKEFYPSIFTRRDYIDFSMVISEVKKWRSAICDTGVRYIPIGMRLSVKRDILSLPFTNDIGKNVIILGSAENLEGEGVIPGRHNMAIGMVQGMSIALALQYLDGNARFVFIDGLAHDVLRNSNTQRWSQLMERFGFPIEFIGADEAADWLFSFKQEINKCEPEEDTYIICLGMDRYSNFSEINLCGESGADTFQQLLKYGTKGVHFICWCSNINTYKAHLGFGNDGYFATKILLRMDTDTSREVLGPFVSWKVKENRAYVHDNSDLPSDEVVIPLMPINNRICGIVESEEW